MTASFHVAATGTVTASSTTDTITLPATLTGGDLMIIAVTANYAVTSVATPHTSFTKLTSAQASGATTATCEVWYAYAASADASAVCTVTVATSCYPATAFASYSNSAISSPIDSSNTDHTTSGSDVSTLPCNSATTASANVLPVSVLGAGANVASPSVTAPSGYTIRSQGGSPDYEAVCIADAAAISSSGTVYGTGSWTIGSSGGVGGATVTFGIKAVGGSPGGASLPVAQVAVAGPAPSLAAGPVALPVAQVAIAAPAPTVGSVHAVALPAAQVAAAALAPKTGAGPVALPVAQVAVAAQAPGIGHTTPLPAAQVAAAAPAPSVARGWTLALPVAQVAISAPAPGITGAGRIVALTPAAVVVQAHPPGLPASSFPQTALGALIEMNLNGTWTDISGYVDYDHQEITLTRGHADESTTASPASLDVALPNSDGRFSDTNPAGPWYGQFGRNTPVRISLPAQTTYLRLEADATSYASCPDATRLHITGSIDVRLDVALTDWTPAMLAGKWDGGGGWAWLLNSDGTMLFGWDDSSDTFWSVNSDAAIPVTRRQTLRVTLNTATGTVTFYTGPSVTGPWTQIGDAISGTSGAATSLLAAASPLKIGYSYNWATYGEDYLSLQGTVFELQVYNGIGGTLVADPLFSAQAAGTASFTDAPGNTWSMSGTAELSSRDYRAHLEAAAFTPSSDPTGKSVYMQMNGSGLLRRIQQGTKPLQSAFRRALPSAPGLVGYWPMEDGNDMSGAGGTPGTPSQIASAIPGQPAGFYQGSPDFASVSSFVCSWPILNPNSGRLNFNLEANPAGTANVQRYLLSVPAGGDSANGGLISSMYTTGTVYRVDLLYYTGGAIGLTGYDSSGNTLFSTGAIGFAINGTPIWVSVELQQVGSNVQYSVVTLQPGAAAAITSGAPTIAGTIGSGIKMLLLASANWASTGIGHLTYQNEWESLFDYAAQLNAYQGETAGNRFARLCAENNLQSRIYGPPDDSVVMGAQTPLSLTSLLQECADADRGLLYEPRQVLGLGYRTRASMQQQAVAIALDYSADDLAGFVESAEDDQYTVNDAVVTRAYTSTGGTGSSAEVALTSGPMSTQAPPDGVGEYLTSATQNLNLDSQCQDGAGWLVNLGTATGPRFPGITYDLAKTGIGTGLFTLPAADMGDRMTIGNFPAWLPPDGADQLIAQTTETFGEFAYKLKWVLVPDRPYLTAIFDDTVFATADTDGSTLASAVTATATSLSVATTTSGSPLWSTAAADVPFDIVIDGERMTVTAISGSSSPQAFTVTRSVNGVAVSHLAGATVDLFYPAIMSL